MKPSIFVASLKVLLVLAAQLLTIANCQGDSSFAAMAAQPNQPLRLPLPPEFANSAITSAVPVGVAPSFQQSSEEKPGSCPQSVSVRDYGWCVSQCRTDMNCSYDQKCCFNGCGTMCMQPVTFDPNAGNDGQQFGSNNRFGGNNNNNMQSKQQQELQQLQQQQQQEYPALSPTLPAPILQEPFQQPRVPSGAQVIWNTAKPQSGSSSFGGGSASKVNGFEAQLPLQAPQCPPTNFLPRSCEVQCHADGDCAATPNSLCCSSGCGKLCIAFTTGSGPKWQLAKPLNASAVAGNNNDMRNGNGFDDPAAAASMPATLEPGQKVFPRTNEKPGSCPALGYGTGGCVQTCSNDQDCEYFYKCCSNGCTMRCVRPSFDGHDDSVSNNNNNQNGNNGQFGGSVATQPTPQKPYFTTQLGYGMRQPYDNMDLMSGGPQGGSQGFQQGSYPASQQRNDAAPFAPVTLSWMNGANPLGSNNQVDSNGRRGFQQPNQNNNQNYQETQTSLPYVPGMGFGNFHQGQGGTSGKPTKRPPSQSSINKPSKDWGTPAVVAGFDGGKLPQKPFPPGLSQQGKLIDDGPSAVVAETATTRRRRRRTTTTPSVPQTTTAMDDFGFSSMAPDVDAIDEPKPMRTMQTVAVAEVTTQAPDLFITDQPIMFNNNLNNQQTFGGLLPTADGLFNGGDADNGDSNGDPTLPPLEEAFQSPSSLDASRHSPASNPQLLLAQQGVVVPETCIVHNQSLLEPSLFPMAGSYLQIYTSIPITCTGQIVAWQFVRFAIDPEASFHASVWRRVNSRKLEFELVGSNRIISGKDRYRKWKTYVVPREERIDVRMGQYIGFFYDSVHIDESKMVVPYLDVDSTPGAADLVESGVAMNTDMREFEEIKLVSNGLVRVTFDLVLYRWRLPALVAYVLPKDDSDNQKMVSKHSNGDASIFGANNLNSKLMPVPPSAKRHRSSSSRNRLQNELTMVGAGNANNREAIEEIHRRLIDEQDRHNQQQRPSASSSYRHQKMDETGLETAAADESESGSSQPNNQPVAVHPPPRPPQHPSSVVPTVTVPKIFAMKQPSQQQSSQQSQQKKQPHLHHHHHHHHHHNRGGEDIEGSNNNYNGNNDNDAGDEMAIGSSEFMNNNVQEQGTIELTGEDGGDFETRASEEEAEMAVSQEEQMMMMSSSSQEDNGSVAPDEEQQQQQKFIKPAVESNGNGRQRLFAAPVPLSPPAAPPGINIVRPTKPSTTGNNNNRNNKTSSNSNNNNNNRMAGPFNAWPPMSKPSSSASHRNNKPAPPSDCTEIVDPGSCRTQIVRFYFDTSLDVCKPFIFTGCGGNANNFRSQMECERYCKPDLRGSNGVNAANNNNNNNNNKIGGSMELHREEDINKHDMMMSHQEQQHQEVHGTGTLHHPPTD